MNKKIDNYEYASLFILTFLSSSIGISLYTTIKYAKLDSYIGIALSTIFSIFPLLIFFLILNYKRDLNIKEKINNLFGKILGTIINYILTILFFIISITIIFNISNFIISQYLSDTNIIYAMILLGIIILFILNKEIESISRTSSIFLFIFIFLFIIAIFSIKKEININNLKPFLEYGIKPTLKASLINSLLTIIPCYSLLIVPRENIIQGNKTIKYLLISYIISYIILFLISVISTSILGKYLLEIYQYPAYISLKKSSLFGFIDRIENFFSLAWILSSFITITINLNYTKEIINHKNNIFINIILVTISIILSYRIFKNNTIFDYYILHYYPYILLSILIIFTLISIKILINKYIKRKS